MAEADIIIDTVSDPLSSKIVRDSLGDGIVKQIQVIIKYKNFFCLFQKMSQ